MKTSRWLSCAALVVAAAALNLLGAQGFAQEKKAKEPAVKKEGKNQTTEGDKAKPGESFQAIQQARAAETFIAFGRERKSPEALIAAAQLLSAIDAKEITEKPEVKKSKDAPKDGADDKKEAKPGPDNSPRALLEEASKLAPDNEHVAALVKQATEELSERSKGSTSGGFVRENVYIGPYETHSYHLSFKGGELACVWVTGNYGDLDVEIYDENNNFIVSDTSYGSTCYVDWQPIWTGPFRIDVINKTGDGSVYKVRTN